MKMTDTHYEHLKGVLTPWYQANRESYTEAGLSKTRFLFDATYAVRDVGQWICDNLYHRSSEYAGTFHDEHLATALRRIERESRR